MFAWQKETVCPVANPPGKENNKAEELPGLLETLGSNSVSLPLQWTSQTKISKACPPLDVIYSTLFLVLFHTAEDSKDKSDQWAGRTEVSVLFQIKSCLCFGGELQKGTHLNHKSF